MSDHTADVVVIGGGSGGYAAALRSAELGKSVVLIEEDLVGGTCLHRGCVPTKALLHTAEVAESVRSAASVGVVATLESIDAAAALAWRAEVVAKKHKGLTGLIARRGITTVPGRGRLTADGAVAVGDDTYRGADTIVATGATSRLLPFAQRGSRVLVSDDALALDAVPESAIIIGGGVIGVEFASAWRSLGADITVIEATDTLVPSEDPMLQKALQRAFRKRGIEVRLGASVAAVNVSDDDVTVALADGEELRAEVVLVAVGRAPHTGDLGLEEAGVATERGFITVDDELRTSVPHVWAVGDVVRGLQLAHRGFAHGIAVAERIAGEQPAPTRDRDVPRVTYSHPELASVGLTEPEAAAQFGAARIRTSEFPLAANAKSEIIGTSGTVKVIREIDGPVVGVHLIGDRVGELITEGQLAVAWDAHPEDLATLIHAHPTQSEALGEAFLALAGKPLHIA